MIHKLEQMLEISKALEIAIDDGDVDRVIELLRHRKELTDVMGHLDTEHPDVKSGKAAEILKEIIDKDRELEKKITDLMQTLQNAILAVQGEQRMVSGYLQQTESVEAKYIDREG